MNKYCKHCVFSLINRNINLKGTGNRDARILLYLVEPDTMASKLKDIKKDTKYDRIRQMYQHLSTGEFDELFRIEYFFKCGTYKLRGKYANQCANIARDEIRSILYPTYIFIAGSVNPNFSIGENKNTLFYCDKADKYINFGYSPFYKNAEDFEPMLKKFVNYVTMGGLGVYTFKYIEDL